VVENLDGAVGDHVGDCCHGARTIAGRSDGTAGGVPGARGQRERPFRRAEPPAHLFAELRTAVVVERLDERAGRTGRAEKRRPEVVEVRVLSLNLERALGHVFEPGAAAELRDLALAAEAAGR